MEAPLYTRTEPYLLPYYPRLFYLTLSEQGYSDDEIFAGLDLSAEQLQDEAFRLTMEQHEEFILRLLELTNDPHLALKLSGQRSDVTPSLPMMAAANSGKIAKSLHLIARYNKIITRVFTVRMLEDSSAPRMDITVHLDHERVVYFAVSIFVLTLSEFFKNLLSDAELVVRLELSVSEPEGFDAVRDRFPFEVLFQSPHNRVYLDPKQIDRPIRQADPQTVRLLTEMAEQQLQAAEAETTLTGAVKALLLEHINSPPTLDVAAQVLGLSSRGLRRKLAECGTSYQSVLDSVREAFAKRLLRETGTPISSIAFELGYSQPSDFGRAFKKWTGQPPTVFRNSR